VSDKLKLALLGLLWDETRTANARGNLRKNLTELRRLVGPCLIITRQAVGFSQDAAYWLDVEAFEARLGRPNHLPPCSYG
jgi:DNA-binding SARP family transcriptional activator